jgi:hypothetical protein
MQRNHRIGSCSQTVCLSRSDAGINILWSGDLSSAEQVITQAIAKTRGHAFEPYVAIGLGLLGELQLARGELQAGIDLLRGSLDFLGIEKHRLQAGELATRLAEGRLLSR